MTERNSYYKTLPKYNQLNSIGFIDNLRGTLKLSDYIIKLSEDIYFRKQKIDQLLKSSNFQGVTEHTKKDLRKYLNSVFSLYSLIGTKVPIKIKSFEDNICTYELSSGSKNLNMQTIISTFDHNLNNGESISSKDSQSNPTNKKLFSESETTLGITNNHTKYSLKEIFMGKLRDNINKSILLNYPCGYINEFQLLFYMISRYLNEGILSGIDFSKEADLFSKINDETEFKTIEVTLDKEFILSTIYMYIEGDRLGEDMCTSKLLELS